MAGRAGGSAPDGMRRSNAYRWLVRTGFVARAVTYGVIGGLTVSLALGAGTDGAAPSQQGALALLGRSVLGRAALVVIAAGLLGYTVWKLDQAWHGHGPEGGGDPETFDRVSNLGGAIVYAAFCAVAVRALLGSAGNGSSQPRHTAAGVLGWTGGPVLVGAAGVALLAISAYQAYDGVSGHFAREAKQEEMDARERRTYLLLGRIGLTSRALVFALVGWFVLRTAIDFNPRKAVGLDGALGRLHGTAYGPWLVGLAALGLLTFSVYSLLEARFRRL